MKLEILNKEALKDTCSLYRIMPFEYLITLFENKDLVLPSPKLWSDPYEKLWFEGMFLDKKDKAAVNKRMFGLCFSEKASSDALWRIYSPTMSGVRIQTDVAALKTQMANTCEFAALGRINYRSLSETRDDFKATTGYPLKEFSPSVYKKVITPWFYKRKAFDYEKEVRLMAFSKTPEQFDDLHLKIDPSQLIQSLQVDPRLPAAEAKVLREKLRDVSGMNMKLITQSNLYS